MKLEFRIAISATPAFYAQVRLIAQSLARLGGEYAQARIQACIGDDFARATIHARIGEPPPPLADVVAANRWAEDFPVQWYLPPDDVRARVPAPPWLSGHARYACASDADIVVLIDADICPIAHFDELLARLHGTAPAVAGLQAHYAPFPGGREVNDAAWRGLLQVIGRPEVPLANAYTLDLKGVQGSAPPYFNYGFVAFNAAAFRAVAASIDACLATACREHPLNRFAAQVALSLAMLETGVDIVALGHEHNCANDDRLLALGLVRPDDVRVIHYLRGNDLDRHEMLCDRALFDAFVASERANAINERLRQHLLALPGACAAGMFA